MAVVHDSPEPLAVVYLLQCLACGNLLECSADTDREACDDIDRYLDGLEDVRCAACRAMPAA